MRKGMITVVGTSMPKAIGRKMLIKAMTENGDNMGMMRRATGNHTRHATRFPGTIMKRTLHTLHTLHTLRMQDIHIRRLCKQMKSAQ